MIWFLGTPGVWYMAEWYGGSAPPPLTSSEWIIRCRRRRGR
jgi:hypothetical protein